MSFSLGRSGDRLGISYVPSTVPKTITAIADYFNPGGAGTGWKTAGTAPQPGDLVRQMLPADFHGANAIANNDCVVQCQGSDVPQYMVWSVNSSFNVSTGVTASQITLTCIKLNKAFSLVMEAGAACALGQSIQANGSAGTLNIGPGVRDQVKGVAQANFSGRVVAINGTVTPFLVVVEWPN